MGLFLGLVLGHILGDFVFQPGRLVIAKRAHPAAAVLHSAIVTACTALALAGAIAAAWPAVVVAGLAHLGVEQLSIRARRHPAATGLTVFLLDQGLHVASLGVITGLLRSDVPSVLFFWPMDAGLVATVTAVAAVAFGGSILVFEVHMRRHPKAEGAGAVLRLDVPRVYGIAERASALLLALMLPVPALAALVFAPRLAYAIAQQGDARNRHLDAAGVGFMLAAAAWLVITTVGPTR